MAGTVKKLQFTEGTNVGAPTDLSLATSTTTISEYVDDAAYVVANGVATAGDVYINSTSRVIRYYTGAAWRNAVPASDPTDATKVFLVDVSGNTTGFSATVTFAATGNRVYTFPDISMTVASRAGTEILTNKTLTAPLITANGSIDVTGAGTLAIGASVGANNMTLGGALSTVVVAGNLQVSGTTTTVNSATLDVTDKNVTVNNGGNDAVSEGAGLTVDRTGTKGSFIYRDTSASKFAIGPLGSELDVVSVSATQGISNKTVTVSDIDGGTASNTSRMTLPKANTATLSGLTRKQATVVYDTDVNKVYYDDGSTLKAMGSGSGSGGRNYCADFTDGSNVGTVGTAIVTDAGNRASGLADWQSTATASVSIVSSTSSPLREGSSYLTTGSGNNSTGATFLETPAWQLDNVDLGKPLLVSFDIGGNTTSADWDVCVVRYNSAGVYQGKIAVAGAASTATFPSANLPTGTTTFRGFFVPSNTQTDYYALRFRRLAGTVNINLDTLTVGPQSIVSGAAMTDWQSYTPAIGAAFGAATGVSAYWRRVGGDLQGKVYFTSGTHTGAIGSITLPSGLTIDTTTVPAASTADGGRGYPIGTYYTDQFASSLGNTGSILAGTTTSTSTVYFSGGSAFGTSAGATSDRFLNITNMTNNSHWTAIFSVPISQWSANVTMAERAVEEFVSNTDTTNTDNTTAFDYGPGGQQFGSYGGGTHSKTCQFRNAGTPTDVHTLEISGNSGATWADIAVAETAGISSFTRQNSVGYGMYISGISPTTVVVSFSDYRYNNNSSYAGAGAAWSGIAAQAQYLWRVRRVQGGAAVGFPISVLNLYDGPSSQIRRDSPASGAAGHGSSSTTVRYYANSVQNIGTAISLNHSSTLGDVFTIMQNGVYGITANDNWSVASEQLAITLNSAALTSNAMAQASGVLLSGANGSVGDSMMSVSWAGILSAGDVIRIMTSAGANGSLSGATKSVSISQLYRLP